MHFAILIDGGFARRKLGTTKAFATADSFSSLVEELCAHQALSTMRLHRVYYYDSVPLEGAETIPLKGGTIEFGNQDVASRSKSLFAELGKRPHFALRMGELSFNGWRLKKRKLDREKGDSLQIQAGDLQPQISQKGVDMRIGMDIAALTLKKLAQVIVLVTGDSDFVPAMKFARREGAQLFLVPLGQHMKSSMYEHSDLILDIDLQKCQPAALPAK